jgi:hypothetical protein
VNARIGLATVLWTKPAERPRALALAREARAYCDTKPNLAAQANDLDAWHAAHERTHTSIHRVAAPDHALVRRDDHRTEARN